jgi:hypothetical protein
MKFHRHERRVEIPLQASSCLPSPRVSARPARLGGYTFYSPGAAGSSRVGGPSSRRPLSMRGAKTRNLSRAASQPCSSSGASRPGSIRAGLSRWVCQTARVALVLSAPLRLSPGTAADSAAKGKHGRRGDRRRFIETPRSRVHTRPRLFTVERGRLERLGGSLFWNQAEARKNRVSAGLEEYKAVKHQLSGRSVRVTEGSTGSGRGAVDPGAAADLFCPRSSDGRAQREVSSAREHAGPTCIRHRPEPATCVQPAAGVEPGRGQPLIDGLVPFGGAPLQGSSPQATRGRRSEPRFVVGHARSLRWNRWPTGANSVGQRDGA